MKTLPAPEVPGNTPWEKFDNAVGTFLSVSKKDFLKADSKWKSQNRRKRAKIKAKKDA
jgi:hypothetical protein